MIKNLKSIKKLFLISGSYLLVDASDRKLLLSINYHRGSYDLLRFGRATKLTKDAMLLAKDLIKRKSKVNLVE